MTGSSSARMAGSTPFGLTNNRIDQNRSNRFRNRSFQQVRRPEPLCLGAVQPERERMTRITRPALPRGRLWHLGIAAAALMLGGAADWIEFPPNERPAQTQAAPTKHTSPQPPPLEAPVLGQAQAANRAQPPAEMAAGPKTKIDALPPRPGETRDTAKTQVAAVAPPKPESSPKAALEIAQWGFTNSRPGGRYPAASSTAVHGGPVYFWIKIKGGQPAVDRLRDDGRLAIAVRWVHDRGSASAGTRDHITELPIGS